MSKLMTAEEMWEDFRSQVLKNFSMKNFSIEPKVIQVERKKMFFAGVASMLCELQKCGEDDVSEEEGAVYLESLKDQLRDWVNNMKRQHEPLH